MKDGEHITYYDTDEILSKFNYLGGKFYGECIYYFISGEILSKRNFIDGELHGECIKYYSSGEISYKCNYVNGSYVTELEWLSYNRNLKLELLGL